MSSRKTFPAQVRHYLEKLATILDDPLDRPFYSQYPLSDLFVEPDVIPTPAEPTANGANGKKRLPISSPQPVPWTSFLRIAQPQAQPRRLLVTGDSGQGKTLLSRWTAVQFAKHELAQLKRRPNSHDVLLPILINLKDLHHHRPSQGECDAALREAVTRFLWPPRLLDALPADFWSSVRQRVHDNTCWLLLDGLDEVDYESIKWVFAVLQDWSCGVIVTSRPCGVRSHLPYEKATLAPFNLPKINALVSTYLPDANKRCILKKLSLRLPTLLPFYTTPLLLSLLCWAVAQPDILDAKLTTATSVYDYVLHRVAALSRDRAVEPHMEDSIPVLTHLARLCFTAFWRNPGSHTIPAPLVLETLGLSTVQTLCASGLIVPSLPDRSTYEFPHRTFIEFLAARELADHLTESPPLQRKAVLDMLDAIMWNSRYHGFFVFAAGLSHDPAPLIALATKSSTDDLRRRRNALAVRMACELNAHTRAHLPELIRPLIAVEIEQWSKMLPRDRSTYPLTRVLGLASPCPSDDLDSLIECATQHAPAVDPTLLAEHIREWHNEGQVQEITKMVLSEDESSGILACLGIIDDSLRGLLGLPHTMWDFGSPSVQPHDTPSDAFEVIVEAITEGAELQPEPDAPHVEPLARNLNAIVMLAETHRIEPTHITTILGYLQSTNTGIVCGALQAIHCGGRPLLDPAVISENVRLYQTTTSDTVRYAVFQTVDGWAYHGMYCVPSENPKDGWGIRDIKDLMRYQKQILVTIDRLHEQLVVDDVPYCVGRAGVVMCEYLAKKGLQWCSMKALCDSFAEEIGDRNASRILAKLQKQLPEYHRLVESVKGKGTRLRPYVSIVDPLPDTGRCRDT